MLRSTAVSVNVFSKRVQEDLLWHNQLSAWKETCKQMQHKWLPKSVIMH